MTKQVYHLDYELIKYIQVSVSVRYRLVRSPLCGATVPTGASGYYCSTVDKGELGNDVYDITHLKYI